VFGYHDREQPGSDDLVFGFVFSSNLIIMQFLGGCTVTPSALQRKMKFFVNFFSCFVASVLYSKVVRVCMSHFISLELQINAVVFMTLHDTTKCTALETQRPPIDESEPPIRARE
jgi:hypothetical protein